MQNYVSIWLIEVIGDLRYSTLHVVRITELLQKKVAHCGRPRSCFQTELSNTENVSLLVECLT